MLDKEAKTERRNGDRRVTDDPVYPGPERRVAERRAQPPRED
ncbi:hypothetical protein [Sphingomonas sp. DT-204]